MSKAPWTRVGLEREMCYTGDRGREAVQLSHLGNEIAFEGHICSSLMRQIHWQDVSKSLNFMDNSIRVGHLSSVLDPWQVGAYHFLYLFLDLFYERNRDHRELT